MKRKHLALIMFTALALMLTGCKSSDYKNAQSLYEDGKYGEAVKIFEELGDYKDSADQAKLSKFMEACDLQDAQQYDEAIALYDELGDYEASAANEEKCYMAKANAFLDEKNYEDALAAVENYQDTEEGKHIADICNVHINGMDGLMTYMEENIEMNSNGHYAKSVTTGSNNGSNVLIWYDKDAGVIKEEVTSADNSSDNGNLSFDMTLFGKDKGSYSFIYDNLKKVNSAYAYYYDTLQVGGSYYIGSVVNAFGTVDLAKFKKGTNIKLKDYTLTTSESDLDKDKFKKTCQAGVNGLAQLGLEGLQQFINEEDLRISINELGIEKYQVVYAQDPYSITHEAGDYTADRAGITGGSNASENNTANVTSDTSSEEATTTASDTSSEKAK